MNSFISAEDAALSERLLADGYVIVPAESTADLQTIRGLCAGVLGWPDLDETHLHCAPEDLNALKLKVMAALNSANWTREAYFNLARSALCALIGSELAMQRKFNLNIQMPGDAMSLLPVHADTWTGDSPYQLVLWVPLVDCYRTKSMFIRPPPGAAQMLNGEQYLEVKYGEVLLFNSSLPHGNRVNEEASTRWTINCRFKSVWSPYAVKGPGEHFEPITLRAASRIGMDYKLPA